MAQLVTRVDDELVAAVDELVSAGLVSSRSDAVRAGARAGYGAEPQDADENAWADQATIRMIADEPW